MKNHLELENSKTINNNPPPKKKGMEKWKKVDVTKKEKKENSLRNEEQITRCLRENRCQQNLMWGTEERQETNQENENNIKVKRIREKVMEVVGKVIIFTLSNL